MDIHFLTQRERIKKIKKVFENESLIPEKFSQKN